MDERSLEDAPVSAVQRQLRHYRCRPRLAELVAKAYGLSSPEDEVMGRYVGINVESGNFVTLFHWPIVKRF